VPHAESVDNATPAHTHPLTHTRSHNGKKKCWRLQHWLEFAKAFLLLRTAFTRHGN